MSKEQRSNNKQREQKFYALFATQNGNEYGGDFSLSYRDCDGILHHTLPWLAPHTEDMKIFRQLTLDNVVVMGFKTFESLGHRPLANRINIVVASRPFNGPSVPTAPWDATQLFFVRTVDEAVTLVRERFKTRDVFFIGGKKILDEVLIQQGQLLDGIYHSKITSDWPKANVDSKHWSEVSTYHIPTSVMESYKLVAQQIGLGNKTETFRCSFWKRSHVPQAEITVEVGIVGVRLWQRGFYEPSAFQESVETHNQVKLSPIRSVTASEQKYDIADPADPVNVNLAFFAEQAKKHEVSSENLEALGAILNQHTVDAAVKTPVGTVVRDRSMAIVDPFDLKDVDDQIKDNVKEFIFSKLAEKGLTATPTDQPKEVFSPRTPSVDKLVPPLPPSDFVGVATEIGELLVIKDAAYGSAFEKTKEILKILFPAGLPVGAYDDALTIMRILDKICRLGVLCTNPEENKTTERSEDAWKDIAGYSIKALCEQRRRLAAAGEGTVQ